MAFETKIIDEAVRDFYNSETREYRRIREGSRRASGSKFPDSETRDRLANKKQPVRYMLAPVSDLGNPAKFASRNAKLLEKFNRAIETNSVGRA